jgi:hypothetical protein
VSSPGEIEFSCLSASSIVTNYHEWIVGGGCLEQKIEENFLKDNFSPAAHEYPFCHGKPEYSCCNLAAFL